jgi:hypothetical protein
LRFAAWLWLYLRLRDSSTHASLVSACSVYWHWSVECALGKETIAIVAVPVDLQGYALVRLVLGHFLLLGGVAFIMFRYRNAGMDELDLFGVLCHALLSCAIPAGTWFAGSRVFEWPLPCSIVLFSSFLPR